MEPALWRECRAFDSLALVGASGIVVNLMVLALATEWLGIYYLYSLFLATIASTVGLCLTELWVFPIVPTRRIRCSALASFHHEYAALLLERADGLHADVGLGCSLLVSNLLSLVHSRCCAGLADK
jgi:putative flippase GtrA